MCCDKKICAICYFLAFVFVAGPGFALFDWGTYIFLLVALLIVPVGFIICLLLSVRDKIWKNSFGICCDPFCHMMGILCDSGSSRSPLSRRRERETGPPSVEDGKTLCYLCKTKVLSEDWESHRNGCAIEHQDKLNIFTPTNKECPRCGKFMKFWEEDGAWFYCSNNRLCPRSEGRPIENTGLTRVNCYLCDISFCKDCGHVEREGDRSTPMATITPPASAPLLKDIVPRDPEATTWIPIAPPPEDQNPPDLFPGQDNGHAELPSYDEAVLVD